jgi:hypothetical protein
MSRKIAVDIGNADERCCNGCKGVGSYYGECIIFRVIRFPSFKDDGSIKWLRCQACLDVEIAPSVPADKVLALIEGINFLIGGIEDYWGETETVNNCRKLRDEILKSLEVEI